VNVFFNEQQHLCPLRQQETVARCVYWMLVLVFMHSSAASCHMQVIMFTNIFIVAI